MWVMLGIFYKRVLEPGQAVRRKLRYIGNSKTTFDIRL